jgi:hypothetical protein
MKSHKGLLEIGVDAVLSNEAASNLRRTLHKQRVPVVSAKLLGSEYPMVVGQPYTIVLQREPQGVSDIQRDLFGSEIVAKAGTKADRRRSDGNIDLDVSFHSATVSVESETTNHRMKKRSSLEVQITPKEVGNNRLEIFVTVPTSKQLLQVLQVPLYVVARREFAR